MDEILAKPIFVHWRYQGVYVIKYGRVDKSHDGCQTLIIAT